MMQNVYPSTEQHVATIVAAYLQMSRGPVSGSDVKDLVIEVRKGFAADLTEDQTDEYEDNHSRTPFDLEPKELGLTPGRKLTPREIQNTIQGDHLICLEDGKKYVILKTPLRAMGLSFDQYRMKWGLPHDYPSVAPNYSASRRALAIAGGLGRQK